MGASLGKFVPFCNLCHEIKTKIDQDSVAGSVIQASGMVLFEDALKAGTIVTNIRTAASICTTPLVNLAPHSRSRPAMPLPRRRIDSWACAICIGNLTSSKGNGVVTIVGAWL